MSHVLAVIAITGFYTILVAACIAVVLWLAESFSDLKR